MQISVFGSLLKHTISYPANSFFTTINCGDRLNILNEPKLEITPCFSMVMKKA